MSTVFSNPAGLRFISFIWMIENKTLKKKVFPPKSNRGKHFSKSQKSASKF
jgi:hypothetical protein